MRWLNTAIMLCAVCFFVGLGSYGQALDVPLIIEDNSGTHRKAWPARGGVPFSPGELQPENVSELSVLDSEGRIVPAQFKPFARWWGRDGSVKWLLVDLLADVPANERTEYRLMRKTSTSPKELRIKETNDRITVFTGPLKAVISKTRGTVLEAVYHDADRNGSFDSREQVIRPDRLNGSIVQSDDQEIVHGESDQYNMWGYGGGRINNYEPAGRLKAHEYASGMQPPEEVVVEAKGPIRATVRIEGKHFPQQEGNGIKTDGLYHYTVWLHFYAGKSHIRMQHSLDNERQTYPMHIYRIKEARLQFAVEGKEQSQYIFGTEGSGNQRGSLSGQKVSLLQDSANRERWDLYNRLKGKSKEEAKKTEGYFFRAKKKLGPAAFRGYKIIEGRTWPSDAHVVHQGDQAPGWGGVHFGRKGLSLYMQRFWMECPKAMRLSQERVEAVFFPEFSPERFQIHSSARKSHELTVAFHSGSDELKEQARNAEAYLYPLHLRSRAERYAGSGAYPRHIGIQEIKKPNDGHWYPHYWRDPNIFSANWRTIGIYDKFNGGGMHYNYWSSFYKYLQGGGLHPWEHGKVKAKWASEWIPWLVHDYSFSAEDPLPQHRIVGWGRKSLYTNQQAAQISGWVSPFTTNVPGFSTPNKFHMDGEHLVHIWPFEWYYLTGSPIAKQGLLAVGNQAKYSTHRHFFGDVSQAPPSLNRLFYFDDQEHPERAPSYFYTRIYACHLLSTAWTYAATGDEPSLFYAKWLARRMLYLQRKNGGTLGGKKRWGDIPPWQEAEAAIAAYALYRETGDEALLDIMGSWLEWVWHEAYKPGQGMPQRFKRGSKPKKYKHHWYPGVAAPLCYAALGDQKALKITREWARSKLPHIDKGEFLDHPSGQSAAYVLTSLQSNKRDKVPPTKVTDLKAELDPGKGVVLTWTAPEEEKSGGAGSSAAARYWIKYSEKPIVDHPSFPDELQSKHGFYHANNIKGEPEPSPGNTQERFVVQRFAPHGAYGSEKKLRISDLSPGTYYFALRSWDRSGNLSEISNEAKIKIE